MGAGWARWVPRKARRTATLLPADRPQAWKQAVAERQLDFLCTNWGGRRKGAGRKRRAPRDRVKHASRPGHPARIPVHVTLRRAPGLPNLRTRANHRVVLNALLASTHGGFRVIHYAVLPNHIHLLCEADDGRAFRSGMLGLCTRLARRLNRAWQRRGAVLDDRYHAHPLKSPTETLHALAYLHRNAERHGLLARGAVDPYSSARWWNSPDERNPFPPPRTWLLREGWRRVLDEA